MSETPSKPVIKLLAEWVVFPWKPFMTSLTAGLLSLAFLCWAVPTAAQEKEREEQSRGYSPFEKSVLEDLFETSPTPEEKKRREMRDSPIYKKKYNKCVLNKITELKTDLAVRVLVQACHSEAKMYYIKQKHGAVRWLGSTG